MSNITLTQAICAHCDLPVPAGLIEEGNEVQFCCRGCAGAYELIHSSGLDSFYRLADADNDQRTLRGKPASSNHFREFDEPVFQEKFAIRISDQHSKMELAIDGLHCGACLWLIEKLPTILPGVLSAVVNWARRTVTVSWQTDEVKLSQIALTLKQLGYSPSPVLKSDRQNRWQFENREQLTRIGVAAACAGNNMIISAALYLGMFSYMTGDMIQLMRVASCLVGLLALLWPGRLFLRSAWSAVRTRTPHMDLPIALGLTVGTLAGVANVIRGAGEIYFDSLSVLIFLLLIGRWIQFRQQSQAASAVELLFQLTPQTTRKLMDGDVVETLIDLIEIGDLIEVRAGDLFAVDGAIVDGTTTVDEAILTGESEAVTKAMGDSISAGTTNLSSRVVIQAAAIGRETRLNKIVELVEQASLEKPAIVLWANRIGGVFVRAVIVLAMFTFAWWVVVDVEIAIDRTIALLIVACPCALALATPLAIAIALGRAAKRQIMIKGGDVLQSLQHPGMIWLDKTGTITEGNLQITHWYGDQRWLDSVALLEKQSSHPVGKALIEFAEKQRRPDWELAQADRSLPDESRQLKPCFVESKNHAGQGISGLVGGHHLLIGNEWLLLEFDIEVSNQQSRIAKRILEHGFSPCWIVVDDIVVAIAAVGDSIRPEAFEAIKNMKARNWQVGILSGDHQEIVNRVARRLDIDFKFAIGGASPEQKLQIVNASHQFDLALESPDTVEASLSRRLQAGGDYLPAENSKPSVLPATTRPATAGTVVMIGDGVNDSAALAAATVGIAVKNGAEASLAAAPVYLAQPGLRPLLKLLSISDSTSRTMRINLGVSLAYNILFAAFAFLGFVNPLVAAILMPISSITVVALSLNAGR